MASPSHVSQAGPSHENTDRGYVLTRAFGVTVNTPYGSCRRHTRGVTDPWIMRVTPSVTSMPLGFILQSLQLELQAQASLDSVSLLSLMLSPHYIRHHSPSLPKPKSSDFI